MEFVKIGAVFIRREYRKKGDGCFLLLRECSVDDGCTCSAECSKHPDPTEQDALSDIVCFNDSSKQGITGKGCTLKTVQNGPSVWVFEGYANLEEITAIPAIDFKKNIVFLI